MVRIAFRSWPGRLPPHRPATFGFSYCRTRQYSRQPLAFRHHPCQKRL